MNKTSNISSNLVGNKIVDNWDVVGASPVGAANYIFILDLTPGFNGLSKDNCKTRLETFKFWDLMRLILEVLGYFRLSKPWDETFHQEYFPISYIEFNTIICIHLPHQLHFFTISSHSHTGRHFPFRRLSMAFEKHGNFHQSPGPIATAVFPTLYLHQPQLANLCRHLRCISVMTSGEYYTGITLQPLNK